MRRPAADISLELQSLTHSGQARGRHEGKLVFAWGGLPDERVTVRVVRRQRRSLNCVVTEVHQPSPARIAPRESHYLCCSPWQIMMEEEEVAWKRATVREIFEQEYHIALPAFELVTDAWYGYRNKLEFSFTDTPEGLSLAFFERGSHRRKLPIEGCLLGTPAINEAAQCICRLLRGGGVMAGALKSLMVRSNQAGQVVAALFVTDRALAIGDPRVDAASVQGLRVFYSDPRSPAAVGTSLLQAYGSPRLEEVLLGRPLGFSDRSFFQINVPPYERALADIRPFVSRERPLFDLYAGVGTIGLLVGGGQTTFVEADDETVVMLRENCSRSGLPDPQILAMPAEKAFSEVSPEATVILDPPRAGIHPRVLKRLWASWPRRIIYLSCNAETQAHDLAQLLDRYQLAFFRAYNFFPRTPHVETLAVLDRI